MLTRCGQVLNTFGDCKIFLEIVCTIVNVVYMLQTQWVNNSLLANFVNNTCPPGIHGMVRPVDGLILEEGTVEVCVNAVWSSVCDSSWDYKDAFVVCRQLGYPATGENDRGPI